MRKIRIISGIFGYRPKGSKFVTPIKAGSPSFELEAAKAARLVENKVAEYVDEEIAVKRVATVPEGSTSGGASVNTGNQENTPGGESNPGETDPLEKPDYHVDMKLDELKEILDQCGLSFRVGMSKADVVEMLDVYFEENAEEDSEGPPDLGVEDPVV